MNGYPLYIVAIVFVALCFDFMNGFHDAANSIATIVSTRVLKPQFAVIWAAAFNFIAFLFFGLHVANTIGKGIVDTSVIDPNVVLAALTGAITWDVITWYFGIPSSSSHALIGGLGGAAIAKAGVRALNTNGFAKISVSIIVSPLLGFALAFTLMVLVSLIFFRTTPRKVTVSEGACSWCLHPFTASGHGANDAQKKPWASSLYCYSHQN